MTELNQYYREVRRGLKGSPTYKATVLNTLKSDAEDFLAEHPGATALDVRQHFGEPVDYASEYAATMGSKELSYKLNVGKKVFLSVVAGILAALFMWSACLAIATIKSAQESEGYSTYEMIE